MNPTPKQALEYQGGFVGKVAASVRPVSAMVLDGPRLGVCRDGPLPLLAFIPALFAERAGYSG
ncbi:MAG: hypothetical protein NT039_00415 [Candidatus Berkelbacteria bacterium]|nr:hypothetical protein [Candidatus Berkelbacteria bacterium]